MRLIKQFFYKLIRRIVFKAFSKKYGLSDYPQLRNLFFTIFSEESAIEDYPVMERMLYKICPEIPMLKSSGSHLFMDNYSNVEKGNDVKIYSPCHLTDVQIGDYTYIAQNSYISMTSIGRFCSIGPNLLCGWGIHPLNGISTHPMFFSTLRQNGMTLSTENKFEERKHISIGNDVFIGANVTILDGVVIGDGAVIGAGAVVSKDIPPYAVAVGCPIQIIKYRFATELCEKLKQIKWWNFDAEHLKDVEKNIFNVNEFITQVSK